MSMRRGASVCQDFAFSSVPRGARMTLLPFVLVVVSLIVAPSHFMTWIVDCHKCKSRY